MSLTKPYPFDFLVTRSCITTASSISPNCWKYARSVSSVVWYGRPPTNNFVNVLSFCRSMGESAISLTQTHTDAHAHAHAHTASVGHAAKQIRKNFFSLKWAPAGGTALLIPRKSRDGKGGVVESAQERGARGTV